MSKWSRFLRIKAAGGSGPPGGNVTVNIQWENIKDFCILVIVFTWLNVEKAGSQWKNTRQVRQRSLAHLGRMNPYKPNTQKKTSLYGTCLEFKEPLKLRCHCRLSRTCQILRVPTIQRLCRRDDSEQLQNEPQLRPWGGTVTGSIWPRPGRGCLTESAPLSAAFCTRAEKPAVRPAFSSIHFQRLSSHNFC